MNDMIALSIEEVWSARTRLLDALSANERRDFETLRYEKRRRDWLAGRIAAKRAMQRTCGLGFGSLEIRAETEGPTSGRPRAIVNGRTVGFLSISHSADLAMATWSRAEVGIDVEVIEPREDSFLDLAFSAEERRRIAATANIDETATRLWCEKEAYAKFLGVGFRRSFSDLVVPDHVGRRGGVFVHRGQSMCWARVSES